MPRRFHLGRSPAPAAEQIDGRAQLKKRIGGWLDSIHPGDWVEDDLLLLG